LSKPAAAKKRKTISMEGKGEGKGLGEGHVEEWHV
jgi:hypothetical protein